ncbi:hypothetical protein V5O48_002451 [Marasmius crinis-equi]|uniref:Uncharacterized protein n=1 Tax=Marasmius crinis-equi TaxID=585013 RepID=A0ABR3FWQ4_9AGAR
MVNATNTRRNTVCPTSTPPPPAPPPPTPPPPTQPAPTRAPPVGLHVPIVTPNSSKIPKPSASEEEWSRQKRVEAQVLKIKAGIDISKRQGVDLRDERLNVTLRNSGTDVILLPEDFDPDYNRQNNASYNLHKLFEDAIGFDDIVRKLGNHQKVAARLRHRARSLAPQSLLLPTLRTG